MAGKSLEKNVKKIYLQKLTPNQEGALHDKKDYFIISFINALSSEKAEKIYCSIGPKKEYRKEYMENQVKWVCDFKEFWGENHHEDPESPKCIKQFNSDLVNSKEYIRYKLYEIAKHPEKMEINNNCKEVRSFYSDLAVIRKLEFRD